MASGLETARRSQPRAARGGILTAARRPGKEAGKQGGRGKKKNLGKKIYQGFRPYDRRTDTQLARASGEENLPQKIAGGFPGRKPFRKQFREGFPRRNPWGKNVPRVSSLSRRPRQEENPCRNNSARVSQGENLGQRIAEGFRGTKTLPQTIGEGFPKRKNLVKTICQGFRSAEAPTSHLPGSQGKIEVMWVLLKRFSPYDPLEV